MKTKKIALSLLVIMFLFAACDPKKQQPAEPAAAEPAQMDTMNKKIITAHVFVKAEKIADFAVHAIANPALKLTLAMANPEIGFEWNGEIHLQAGARKRDVLQVGNDSPGSATRVLPPDIHQIGT